VDLQAIGESLDRETGGKWVADELVTLMSQNHTAKGFVVDAVMIPEQVEGVRRAAQGAVIHVHLTAPLPELESRYTEKRGGIEEAGSYSVVLRNATEANVGELGKLANLVVDTTKTSLDDEVDLVVERLDQESV
jgi:hypothetical protein